MFLSVAIILANNSSFYPEPLTLESFVKQVRRADYKGDIPVLQCLYTLSEALLVDGKRSGLVRYWRGFALWRKAMNGFNEKADHEKYGVDLEMAVTEFALSVAADPNMVDSKIGKAACLMNLTFLSSSNQAKASKYVSVFVPLMKEAEAQDPLNARLYWVKGPMLWYIPEDRGGGEKRAFEAYEFGFRILAKSKTMDPDSVVPAWGEAELLMNRAWAKLHAVPHQADAAEIDARKALKLVPYWHYLRDILLPEIEKAKMTISENELSYEEQKETKNHAKSYAF